jgi:predicted acetyltransferase
MDVAVRLLQPGEERAFIKSVRTPFLEPPTGDPEQEAGDERWAKHIELDRAWVAEDHHGRFVANCCVYSMDVTLPAAPGQPAPLAQMAGVSAVGVHPTHRRRGLLRQMMAAMFDDARARQEPVAGLLASESVIYGRFGYGYATAGHEYTIDRRESAFLKPAPEIAIELIDRDDAAKALPPIFDRHRRTRAGEPDRNESRWTHIIADPTAERHGGTMAFNAVCDGGYVRYRAHEGEHKAKIVIEELRGMTPDIEAALWRFVLDLDLVTTVVAKRRPVDEQLLWRLADPRQLAVTNVEDRLYVRILDVPAALTARGYRRPGRLTLDVLAPQDTLDGQDDPAPGRWVLDAGPDGAECRPAKPSEEPDLRLAVTDLGAIYLGGFPASTLAAGGRVEELRPGSLDVADALFATTPAPMTGTGF